MSLESKEELYTYFVLLFFFFQKQIYIKVESTTITEINKCIYKSIETNKKAYKQIKRRKDPLPTHPVCFSLCIIKLLVKCYL